MLHNVPILPETLICRVIFQSKCEPASVAGDSTKSRCDRKSFQIRPRSWDQVLFCGRSADTERWWSDVWEIKSPTKLGKSRPNFTKPKSFLSCLVSHLISFYRLPVSVAFNWKVMSAKSLNPVIVVFSLCHINQQTWLFKILDEIASLDFKLSVGQWVTHTFSRFSDNQGFNDSMIIIDYSMIINDDQL